MEARPQNTSANARVCGPRGHELSQATRPLAALLEPYFAPEETSGANGPPFLTTSEQLLEGSAVLLRCLVVLADGQVSADEEAHLATSAAALFGDDEAVYILRRLMERLRRKPLDRRTVGALIRHAYDPGSRKLLLLLALEAALADGQVQPEEVTLLRDLRKDLDISNGEARLLHQIAGRAPLQALDTRAAGDGCREHCQTLLCELSPSAFGALADCPGLSQSLRQAHAALAEWAQSHAVYAPSASQAQNDEHQRVIARSGEDIQRLGEHAARLRNSSAGPYLELVSGLQETLGETQLRAEQTGLSVAVLGAYDAGKSTLLNALLGDELLPCGGGATTAAVTIVRGGPRPTLEGRYRSRAAEAVALEPVRFADLARLAPAPDFESASRALDTQDLTQLTLGGPYPFCRSGVQLIDTPGQAPVAIRTALVMNHVRESDLAVVVSNATQTSAAEDWVTVTRLLAARPTSPVLVAVTHWDLIPEEERDALKTSYGQRAAALNVDARRVVLRFVSPARALMALRRTPVPTDDPWLESFREFRREMLEHLARVRAPRRVNQLRSSLLQVAEETHALSAVRLHELLNQDAPGAERALRRLQESAVGLEVMLATAAEHFSMHVADGCADLIDTTLRSLGEFAARWETTWDPRWPGNTARIRRAFENKAQRHVEQCLHSWCEAQVPALLVGALRRAESGSTIAAMSAIDDAIGLVRGGAPPPGTEGLLSLVRLSGPWHALQDRGTLDLSWPLVGASLAHRLGPRLTLELLGRQGELGAAIVAGIGLGLMVRGHDDLSERVRQGFVDGMLQERARVVEVARSRAAAAAREDFRDLTDRVQRGFERLQSDARSRCRLVRANAATRDEARRHLESAQETCAAICRTHVTPKRPSTPTQVE